MDAAGPANARHHTSRIVGNAIGAAIVVLAHLGLATQCLVVRPPIANTIAVVAGDPIAGLASPPKWRWSGGVTSRVIGEPTTSTGWESTQTISPGDRIAIPASRDCRPDANHACGRQPRPPTTPPVPCRTPPSAPPPPISPTPNLAAASVPGTLPLAADAGQPIGAGLWPHASWDIRHRASGSNRTLPRGRLRLTSATRSGPGPLDAASQTSPTPASGQIRGPHQSDGPAGRAAVAKMLKRPGSLGRAKL